MWPTLVSIGPLAIHSFGVMLFLGLFFGGFKLWKKAKEEGWEETAVMDTWLTAAAAAVAAGRAGYVVSHWEQFGASWYRIVFLTKFPGLSGEAAWLGGVVILLTAALKKRFEFWRFAEALVPALVAAEVFTRIGGFLAGSGPGKPAPAAWGGKFPGFEGERYPVQLMAAVLLAGFYLVLTGLEKRYRGFGWAKEGFILGVYLLVLGGIRLGLSFLEESGTVWWGAVLMAAGGLILLGRSAINIKVPLINKKPAKPKRKKHGFDYV